MMKKWPLLTKIGVLISLTLLMLIPVSTIVDLIDERHEYELDVVAHITASSGGRQVILGPIVVQPYIQHTKQIVNGKTIKSDVERQRYILPENVAIKGSLDVAKKKLGIYDTQVYRGDITFIGQFPAFNAGLAKENITLKTPYLVVLLADTRGIVNVPILTINQRQYAFEPGTAASGFFRGIHSTLPAGSALANKANQFEFVVSLQGSQSLSVVPIGRVSNLQLSANWPHPNFLGDFLPFEKTIVDNGFSAAWQSSWFANNINEYFTNFDPRQHSLDINQLPSFNVNLIELVNEYQLNERSVKYSVLFIGLTFVAFFLFEVLTRLRIHPIQYLLVGSALALFYLLLLALSEHIGFTKAYFIGAVACSMLISFYLSAVLRGIFRGALFGIGLMSLYSMLFALLQSENTALLLGSFVLFLALAMIMGLTRRLDWYHFSQDLGGSGVADRHEDSHNDILDEIDRKHCRLWK